MEDQDRTEQTLPDEEVEGHSHKDSHKDSHTAAQDEGEEVEGHMHKHAHKDKHKD